MVDGAEDDRSHRRARRKTPVAGMTERADELPDGQWSITDPAAHSATPRRTIIREFLAVVHTIAAMCAMCRYYVM